MTLLIYLSCSFKNNDLLTDLKVSWPIIILDCWLNLYFKFNTSRQLYTILPKAIQAKLFLLHRRKIYMLDGVHWKPVTVIFTQHTGSETPWSKIKFQKNSPLCFLYFLKMVFHCFAFRHNRCSAVVSQCSHVCNNRRINSSTLQSK